MGGRRHHRLDAEETRTEGKRSSKAGEIKNHQAHITQGSLGFRETALSSSTNRECYRRNLVTLTKTTAGKQSRCLLHTRRKQDRPRAHHVCFWNYRNKNLGVGPQACNRCGEVEGDSPWGPPASQLMMVVTGPGSQDPQGHVGLLHGHAVDTPVQNPVFGSSPC